MKKALVLSLGMRSTAENYGAILQMTSFCYYIYNKYNIVPEILDYYGKNLEKYGTNKVMTKMLFGNTYKEIIRKILFSKLIEKRYNSNIKFVKDNVKTTKIYTLESLKNVEMDYDYYIAESDVIWDPTFRQSGFDPVFFLALPSFKSGKKLVYAAGVGNANFSDSQKKEFCRLIDNIDLWSVREKYSKNYIENIISQKVECVLDPTLMVEEEYFKSFIKKRIIKHKYVLVYTPAFYNKKLINDAYDYAKRNNCKVIIIKRVPSLNHLFDTKVNVGISKFLNYLNYCEAFFCDSYHGVCFSIQLKKEFYVYEREDGKKISDLCIRLGLEDRLVKGTLPIKKIDYNKVYKQLKEERKISEHFFNKCFK